MTASTPGVAPSFAAWLRHFGGEAVEDVTVAVDLLGAADLGEHCVMARFEVRSCSPTTAGLFGSIFWPFFGLVAG